MKPIETRYAGCRFRSRAEARWAVFFDALGIKWEYEAQGFTDGTHSYLPDFWMPELDTWVEIKGGSKFGVLTAEEASKMWPFAIDAWLRKQRFRVLWAVPRILCEHFEFGYQRRIPAVSCMTLTDMRQSMIDEGCELYEAVGGVDMMALPKLPEARPRRSGSKGGFLAAVAPGETEGHPAWSLVQWIPGYSWEEMTGALEAARSARFEHGEVTVPRRLTRPAPAEIPDEPHPRQPSCDPREIIPAGMTGLEGTPEAFSRWQADVGFTLPEGMTAGREGSQIRFFSGFPEDKIVVQMLEEFGITVLPAGIHVPGIDFTRQADPGKLGRALPPGRPS